jgi:hypothetical protein
MTNPNPGRVSANIPREPDRSRSADWESLISRMEQSLQELRDFLKNNGAVPGAQKEPESHVYLTSLSDSRQEEQKTRKNSETNTLPHNWVKFAVTPGEAEAIIDQVGKCGQESVIMERLAKVERQTRRLAVLSVIYSALMAVFLLFAGILWLETNSSGRSPFQMTQAPSSATATGEMAGSSPEAGSSPNLPVSLATPAKTPSTRTEVLRADRPGPTAAASFPGSEESSKTPDVKAQTTQYVGSVTSNKYHYPDCRWAKTIHPARLRVFSSVSEARQAGYIPCPTCQPPKADEPNSREAE